MQVNIPYIDIDAMGIERGDFSTAMLAFPLRPSSLYGRHLGRRKLVGFKEDTGQSLIWVLFNSSTDILQVISETTQKGDMSPSANIYLDISHKQQNSYFRPFVKKQ